MEMYHLHLTIRGVEDVPNSTESTELIVNRSTIHVMKGLGRIILQTSTPAESLTEAVRWSLPDLVRAAEIVDSDGEGK